MSKPRKKRISVGDIWTAKNAEFPDLRFLFKVVLAEVDSGDRQAFLAVKCRPWTKTLVIDGSSALWFDSFGVEIEPAGFVAFELLQKRRAR